MHKNIHPPVKLDQEIGRTVNTILNYVDKKHKKEARKLTKVLISLLYKRHLTVFSGNVLWLSQNVVGLVAARKLTSNFKDALDLLAILSKIRDIGFSEFKYDLEANVPVKDHTEEITMESFNLRELEKIFKEHIREEKKEDVM